MFSTRRTRPRLAPWGVEVLEGRSLMASLMVTNVLDSGPGSFRQAILDANTDIDSSLIRFVIEGEGVQTIRLATGLPPIVYPLAIDATTQPGYAGTPLVALDGRDVMGFAYGLQFSFLAFNSSATGLAIQRFPSGGISGGVNGLLIRNNYIGVDPTGAGDAGNGGAGLQIFGGPVTIGGDPAGGNVIAGNKGAGVVLSSTLGARITNNLIGTDASGRTDLGNGDDGVTISLGSINIFVGSNVIANNGRLAVADQGTNTVLTDNVVANNGNLIANVVVTASSTAVVTTTGQFLTFTYTLTNQGPHEATNLNFGLQSRSFAQNFDFFIPPPVFRLISATATQGTINPEARLNDFVSREFDRLGTLAPGASAAVTIVVQTANAGVDTLEATSSSDQPTTDPRITAATTVAANATSDLAVTALPIPATTRVGAPLAFTFLVTNLGTTDSVTPTVNLDLAGLAGATIISVATSQGTLNASPERPDLYTGTLDVQRPGTFYIFDRIGLTPGASATITVIVIPQTVGRLSVALATSASLNVDPDPVNNLAFAGVETRLLPTVTRASLQPGIGAIRSLTIDFDSAITRLMAVNLRNYQVQSGGTKIGLRAATDDASAGSVRLRFARPIARKGPSVQLRVGSPRSTAPDGLILFGGPYRTTLNRT